MNKKSIDKITNTTSYNQLLFTHSAAAAQALQRLIPNSDSVSPNHKKTLLEKQKQLEVAIKNAIATMGRFVDIQKAPLASPLDHSLDIFEAIGDNIQMAVQRYRENSKNGTLDKAKTEKQESKRPQDQYQFIKPARFEFHHHEKDLSCIRTDLSFTKSRPLEDKLHYVKTEEDLEAMIKDLKEQSEIAVDVEHSSRSYEGLTCLLQFSTRNNDYIVDVFPIWQSLPALKEVMQNPAIVKVMHGAQMDTKWLQRDFNVHIHNLFDTYRAARTLGLQRLSYAFLLSHYCQVNTDKTFQTADWRQRPLSQDMIHYARLDTHYLLEIFDRLRADIHQKALSMGLSPEQVFVDIYSTSHEVTRTEVELFDVNRKECLQQLRREFKDAEYEVFSKVFGILDDIAKECDVPFDEIVNHRTEKQLIAKMKELLLVRPDFIVIKIDKLIADLRAIDHLKPHLSTIKEFLSSFFAKRQSIPMKEKKSQKPILTHIEEEGLAEPQKINKVELKVIFKEYHAKTYENFNANSFSMVKFEPIASFLANRFGVAGKEEEKLEAEIDESVSEGVGEGSEEQGGEQSNQEAGVIEFKRINPNVIYTIEDAEPVEEKYKPRKKRKEEDYEKKMLQKQKNIFELLED